VHPAAEIHKAKVSFFVLHELKQRGAGIKRSKYSLFKIANKTQKNALILNISHAHIGSMVAHPSKSRFHPIASTPSPSEQSI
jgi:hypothetical protein